MFNKSQANANRTVQTYLEFAIKVGVSFALFIYIGNLADSTYKTTPIFTLVGTLVSIISFFVSFYQLIKKITKKSSSKKDNDE